jgi:cytochrome c553
MAVWIRRFIWVLIGALLLLGLVLAAVVWRGTYRLGQRHAVQVPPQSLPVSTATPQQARYLYARFGCAGCHGEGGAGKVMWSSGSNVLRSSHIAPGAGSAIDGYRSDDWVRAVRHGLGKDGRALLMMPSVDFQRMSDADLAAVAAHAAGLPAQTSLGERHQLGWLMRALIGVGVIPLAPDRLEPGVLPSPAQTPAVTAQWGGYVAQTCVGCHGQNLSGGPIPGMPPGTPPAPNLTAVAGGVMARYATLADFGSMFKTGRRRDGSQVAVMPFESLAQLDDTDLAALHLHLKSLPARITGRR